jgi:hypothetical protein
MPLGGFEFRRLRRAPGAELEVGELRCCDG